MQDQRIPLGFCQCGCGTRTRIATRTDRRDGTVRGRPLRYVHSSHKVASTMTLYVVDEAECWVWQRPLNAKGYGGLYDPRTRSVRAAHRVIYERERGVVLAGDIHLHHLCGVKACVNPDHLEPVGNSEHGGGKELRAIRLLVAEGVSTALVARAFRITEDRVIAINGGK